MSNMRSVRRVPGKKEEKALDKPEEEWSGCLLQSGQAMLVDLVILAAYLGKVPPVLVIDRRRFGLPASTMRCHARECVETLHVSLHATNLYAVPLMQCHQMPSLR